MMVVIITGAVFRRKLKAKNDLPAPGGPDTGVLLVLIIIDAAFPEKAKRTRHLAFRRGFCGCLLRKRAAEIVPELHLDAVLAYDDGFRRHREQIVPGPVDHEPGRERGQHEGED